MSVPLQPPPKNLDKLDLASQVREMARWMYEVYRRLTSQVITGKTIDGDDNTIQDLALTTLKTVVGDANKVIRRNGLGVVVSDNPVPDSSALMTVDSTQGVSNKTMGASNKYGGAASYTAFQADGFRQAFGGATGWEDVNFAAIALGTGPTAPALVAVNGSTVYTRAFSGTNPLPDELFGALEIPHSYKSGSNFIPHLHWMPTTADAGDVKWQLSYYIANGSALGVTPTTITVTAAASGTAWLSTRTDFPAVTGTGFTYGNQIVYRLFRDATDVADTYAQNAAILTMGFHFELDTHGSNTVASKT